MCQVGAPPDIGFVYISVLEEEDLRLRILIPQVLVVKTNHKVERSTVLERMLLEFTYSMLLVNRENNLKNDKEFAEMLLEKK